jgi:MinD-like ATPase involved in chromosome partitioning or flagellar assembly
MKIVSFYSFKGGVGRSLSLLNLGCHLAYRMGQRVGLMDLDVEAGGLSHLLGIAVPESRDLLTLLEPTNRDVASLEQYVIGVPEPGRRQETRLFLVPTVADSQLLDQVEWNQNTQRFLMDHLFPAFKQLYHLDYLLLDSRSGLSQTATFTITAAEIEVLVCRLDSQTRYGMKRMVDVCQASGKPFRIVATAVPEKGRARALVRFHEEVGVPVDVVVPYESSLYYQEEVYSWVHRRHPVSRAYGQLYIRA